MSTIKFICKKPNEELEYKDVYLVPQLSEVTSRKQVNTAVFIKGLKIDVPVISANMDTCTGFDMANAMYTGGAIGALHRFMPIEQNVSEYKLVKEHNCEAFVSIGVNDESRDRARALYDVGARYFVIDIAHGHSLMMKTMIKWLRGTYGEEIVIMAGNVATKQAVVDLHHWGADLIKVGIGPGAACLTKNVTGTTRPQFSAVLECAEAGYPIVADGGIREIGDICKAIGAGATFVMAGRLFAGCKEAPGERINGQKVYRGMASKDAMLTIRKDDGTLPTPEGKSFTIPEEGSAKEVVAHIKGGLQSAMSYANATYISDFQEKALFGVRFTAQ